MRLGGDGRWEVGVENGRKWDEGLREEGGKKGKKGRNKGKGERRESIMEEGRERDRLWSEKKKRMASGVKSRET